MPFVVQTIMEDGGTADTSKPGIGLPDNLFPSLFRTSADRDLCPGGWSIIFTLEFPPE